MNLNLGLGCFGVPARPAQPKPGWQSQCCWLPPPQELDELGFLLVPIARPESFFFFFFSGKLLSADRPRPFLARPPSHPSRAPRRVLLSGRRWRIRWRRPMGPGALPAWLQPR